MSEDNIEKEGVRVYEIGVHYVSSLPEAQVGELFAAQKESLTKKGAEIISEEQPKLRGLAYTIVKHLSGKNVRFDNAYFGWVKFEIGSDKLDSIKEELDANTDVLRHIMVKTVRENTLQGHKFQEAGAKRETSPRPAAPAASSPDAAQVDKAIDNLVV